MVVFMDTTPSNFAGPAIGLQSTWLYSIDLTHLDAEPLATFDQVEANRSMLVDALDVRGEIAPIYLTPHHRMLSQLAFHAAKLVRTAWDGFAVDIRIHLDLREAAVPFLVIDSGSARLFAAISKEEPKQFASYANFLLQDRIALESILDIEAVIQEIIGDLDEAGL